MNDLKSFERTLKTLFTERTIFWNIIFKNDSFLMNKRFFAQMFKNKIDGKLTIILRTNEINFFQTIKNV